MKLHFVMRDLDFLSAFIEQAGRSSQDVTMEISGGLDQAIDADHSFERDGFINVTDYGIRELAGNCSRRMMESTVFLTELPEDGEGDPDNGPYSIFKYQRVDSLLADLRFIYGLKGGEEPGGEGEGTRIAVFCDGDEIASGRFCQMVARQLVYLCGLSVLIFPLTQIIGGEEGEEHMDQRFKRMMYHIASGKKISSDAFFVEDSYGVHHFRMPGGVNPFCGMSTREILGVTRCVSDRIFDVVIFHIGTACTKQGVQVIKSSGTRIWIHSSDAEGERSDLPVRILGGEEYVRDLWTIDVREMGDLIELTSEDMIRKMVSV